MAYRPIQISPVEVKIKGEPLGDALSSRTVEPIALLQQGFKSRTGFEPVFESRRAFASVIRDFGRV